MNKVLRQVVDYSNGEWKRVSDMYKDIGIKGGRRGPLSKLIAFGAIIIDTMENEQGEVIWYRAYDTTKRDFFELARLRKAAGILSAPESFSLRRSA